MNAGGPSQLQAIDVSEHQAPASPKGTILVVDDEPDRKSVV